MPILPSGSFTFTIPSQDLARGLRPASSSPRNVKFLTECNGAVGLDNVLQVLRDLNLDHLIDTSLITDSFPYPQLFVFTNHILICSATTIYEYTHSSPGTLSAKIAVAPGILWSAVDYYDYIYMSNCATAVVRHAEDGSWEEVTNLPSARAMCNYNGQIVISPCSEPIIPSEDEEEEPPPEGKTKMDLPDVYLELNCCNMSATGFTGGSISRTGLMKETEVPFDPANYDGSIRMWFEVTVHNASGSYESPQVDTYLSLVDTSGHVYATIDIPVMADDYDMHTYRVEFTPPISAVTFGLYCPQIGTEYGQWLICSCARVKIRQLQATKSRVQWPMLSFGTFFSTGYEFVANSIPVYNCPDYTPDFSDDDGNSYYNLPVWKYNVEDMYPVTGVEFRALPGKYVPQPYADCWFKNVSTMTSTDMALYYSDDAGVTKILIPGSYVSFTNPDDPFPWVFNISLPTAVFEVGSRIFYVGHSFGGGTVYTELNFPAGQLYIPPGSSVALAIWSGHSFTSGDNPDDSMSFNLDLVCDEANIEGLSIAIFDRDTDTIITGSELTWAKGEVFDWKSVSIDPTNFTSGHELEVRVKSPSEDYNTAPRLGEAQLYWNVDYVNFTSWQRVMTTFVGFWDYPDGYGVVYDPYGDSAVSALSRLLYHEVDGAVVGYQACAMAYAWPSEAYPYDPLDPGSEYQYLALWDDELNDEGVFNTLNRVDSSMLEWLEADFDVDQKRVLKRTVGDISEDLVDGHRYCSLQPDDLIWMDPLDGYLVMTVGVP